MKMRKITANIIILIIVLFAIDCKKKESVHTGNSLNWYNYNEGIEVAKKEKKIVLVDFYADWCRWCHVMEKEIFSDTEMIKKINKDFICIRLIMDNPNAGIINYKGNEFSNQQFSMAMGVSGLPSLLFLNSNEEIISLVPGYTQKPLFDKIITSLSDYIKKKCMDSNINFNDFIAGTAKCNE